MWKITKAAWPPLTQRGIYWGAVCTLVGGALAALGVTTRGAALLLTGVALGLPCLASWAD